MSEKPTIPHAEKVEYELLAAMFQRPEECIPRAVADGLTVGSFYIEKHQILFRELTERIKRGDAIDWASLCDELPEPTIEMLGGPSALSEWYRHCQGVGQWGGWVKSLRENQARREAINQGNALIAAGASGNTDQIPGILESASFNIEGLTSPRAESLSLLDQAYALRFNPEDVPPPEETCLSIGGYPIAAQGNLTVIQGKSKVGKSATVASILGAAQRGQYSATGDTLKMEWHGGEGGAILHFDTEQSPGDWHALVNRSVSRSGLHEVSPRLVSIPLVRFAISERFTILKGALERERDEKGGIDLVVIDGIADLCISPNDEGEALELVSKTMALSQDYSTGIVCGLHENPSTDQGKTRGHLGSELNRKAFANIRIDKEDELSTIYGTEMRKREIPKNQGFCFSWDDAEGMHIYQGRAAGMGAAKAEDKKRTVAREEMENAWNLGNFEEFPLARNSELILAIGEREGNGLSKKPDAIKKRITKAETLGVITKTESGVYRLNKEGNEGN